MFGGTDWHGAEAIHRAIQRARFGRDIRALGFVSDKALPDLYRAATLLVYPSLREGFGLPPIEAMACRCPVIASTRGALGEVVGEAAALVDPEDIDSIAKQIQTVASDAKVREHLRAAGLARARKFDWKQTAEQTMKVYERVTQMTEIFHPPVRARSEHQWTLERVIDAVESFASAAEEN